MKRCHGRLHYDRKFQIFIFLIGHINVNKGVFCLIISYLQIQSYNVLNYNNCSTDWHLPLDKENSLFLTILNYFRQILVAFKYFVQSDWRIIIKEPGTAIQCKTKDSSCHRQSSIRVLSGIRAAQSSVFCVVFCRPLFIILSFFVWPLHCLPFFDL